MQRTLATIVTGLFLIACSDSNKPRTVVRPLGTHSTTQEPTSYTPQRITIAEPEPVTQKGGKVTYPDLKNAQDARSNLIVYFRTNSWTLGENDKKDVTRFIQTVPAYSWILEGYADARGSIEDNRELGNKRAQGIADIYLKGKKVQIVSYGETKAHCAETDAECMKEDRRVRIIPYVVTTQVSTVKAKTIDEGIKQLGRTDAYLVDLSSSMREELSFIQHYDYQGPQVYGFNSCSPIFNVSSDSAQVCGTTPLWDSLTSVVNKLDNGTSLTIISDGGNNKGSESPNAAIKAAKDKGILINVIATGTYNSHAKKDLEQVAAQTGGKPPYIQQ